MALVFAPWFLCSIVVRRFSSCSQRNQCVRHAGASAARRSCIILQLYERARWSALAQAAPSSTDTCGPPTSGIGARARVLEVCETSSTGSRRTGSSPSSEPPPRPLRRDRRRGHITFLSAMSASPISTAPRDIPCIAYHAVGEVLVDGLPSDQSGTPPISQVGPEPIQDDRGPVSSADQKCHMGGAP